MSLSSGTEELINLCNLFSMEKILENLKGDSVSQKKHKNYSPSIVIQEDDDEYMQDSLSFVHRSSKRQTKDRVIKQEQQTRNLAPGNNSRSNKKDKRSTPRKFQQPKNFQSPSVNCNNNNTSRKRKAKKFETPARNISPSKPPQQTISKPQNNNTAFVRIDDLLQQLTKSKNNSTNSFQQMNYNNISNPKSSHLASNSNNMFKYQHDGYAAYTHYNTIKPKNQSDVSNYQKFMNKSNDYGSAHRNYMRNQKQTFSARDNYSECESSLLNPYGYASDEKFVNKYTNAANSGKFNLGNNKNSYSQANMNINPVMYVPVSRNQSHQSLFGGKGGIHVSKSESNLQGKYSLHSRSGSQSRSHSRSHSRQYSRSHSKSHSASRSPINRHSFYQIPKTISNKTKSGLQNQPSQTYKTKNSYINSSNSMLSKFQQQILSQDDYQDKSKGYSNKSKITTTTQRPNFNNRQMTASNTIINKLQQNSVQNISCNQQEDDTIFIDEIAKNEELKNPNYINLNPHIRQSLTYLSQARVPPKPIPIQIKK